MKLIRLISGIIWGVCVITLIVWSTIQHPIAIAEIFVGLMWISLIVFNISNVILAGK